jgi:hypothetical protein
VPQFLEKIVKSTVVDHKKVIWVIKVFEGLPIFLRVRFEGQAPKIA